MSKGRFAKGSPEAKEWARKMREARMKKVKGGMITPPPPDEPVKSIRGRKDKDNRLLLLPDEMFRIVVSNMDYDTALALSRMEGLSETKRSFVRMRLDELTPKAPKVTQRKRLTKGGGVPPPSRLPPSTPAAEMSITGMGMGCMECDRCCGTGLIKGGRLPPTQREETPAQPQTQEAPAPLFAPITTIPQMGTQRIAAIQGVEELGDIYESLRQELRTADRDEDGIITSVDLENRVNNYVNNIISFVQSHRNYISPADGDFLNMMGTEIRMLAFAPTIQRNARRRMF